MDRRTAHIRRQRASNRLQKRLGIIAMTGIAICAMATFMLVRQTDAEPNAGLNEATLAAAAPAGGAVVVSDSGKVRRVYRYSVVPGGVADRGELVHAVRNDKVVAAHYAAFDLSRASVHAVDKPRAVYVSYRKGDKVYWTAGKTMLAQGETVLTDGKNEIRGRCGNRISDVPQLPVEVKGPSVAELDESSEAVPGEGGQMVQTAFADEDGAQAASSYPVGTFPTGGLLAGSSAQTGSTGGADGLGGSSPRFAGIQSASTGSMSGSLSGNLSGSIAGRTATGTSTLVTSSDQSSSDGSDATAGSAGDTGVAGAGAPGTTASSPIVSGTGSLSGNSGTTGGPRRAGTTTTSNTSADGETPPTLTGDPPAPAGTDQVTPKPSGTVPEPDSLWLSGIAFAAMLVLRRRKAPAKR